MKLKKYIWTILLIFIVAGLSTIGFKGIQYIERLELQIYERDSLINKLTISEEIVREYFNVKRDSLTNELIYTLKTSKKDPVQIIYRNQAETFKAGDEILNSTDVVNRYNNLLNDFNEIEVVYNNLIKEHKELIKQYNELVVIYNNWSGDIAYSNALKAALTQIKNVYDINYEIIKDSTAYKVILHPSAKIDSALVLLPYFRDNLKRDDEIGAWIITRTTIQEKGKKR